MPTTNDSRAIKINANGPKKPPIKPTFSIPKLIIFGILAAVVVLSISTFGCKFGFLPAGMCGNNNLNSNTLPLTPVPTETPLPLVVAPTVEKLDSCGIGQQQWSPCGSNHLGTSKSYCGENGNGIYMLKFNVTAQIAEKIMLDANQGGYADTNPAGICQWLNVTASHVQGGVTVYVAEMQCTAPSGTQFTILPTGHDISSCTVTDPCPEGYVFEGANLESKEEYYCVPDEKKIIKSPSCDADMYLDEELSCCLWKPEDSVDFTCPNPIIMDDGFSCDLPKTSYYLHEPIQLVMPTCAQPPRPNTDTEDQNREEEPRVEPTACVPDPTGGGCP